MFAIAAATFGSPSETFIQDHARLLAPNATVLICRDATGVTRFGYPTLLNICPGGPAQGFKSRLFRAVRRRWLHYCDPIRAYLDNNLYAKLTTDDVARLRSFLDRYKPVSLLAEYGPVGLQVSKACALANIPLFVHFHGWDANILGESWSIRRDYCRLFKTVKGVIVTTEFFKGRVRALGCPESKLHVCPCGVDIESFRPGPYVKGERILMVSRLMPQKGPEYSLSSFARVAKDHPHAVLEIIGDGPLRTRLEKQAADLGISQRTIFHGACDHAFVRERMRDAALFVQHSVTIPGDGVESQGLSILEAMASGVPVVATRHGAIPETVDHGITGYLVNERDTVAMADAIGRLLRHPAEAADMGAAGRRRVTVRYSQDFAIDRLRSILGLTFPGERLASV
jgi:colanic acid/amylovoran biosynthesis glycosyltransferase